MSNLTATKITNLYLYGEETTPQELTDESLIRPSNADLTASQDKAEYMSSGAGRFAVGSSFAIVEQFFTNAEIPAGNYTKAQLGAYLGLSYYGLIIQQADLYDGAGDYAERTYIWNTGAFKINDNARFIIDPNGDRWIENFSITPDGNDNFDFVSSSIPQFVNDALRNDIDPSQIGRKVIIGFTGDVPTRTYTLSDYQADLAYKATWTSPPNLFDAMRGLTNGLWAAGVTRFLDDEDRPILYGTDGDDTLSSIQLQGHYYLGSYVGNGVVEFGGKGSDILRGSPSDDRLNGNAGNDIVQGFVGDDELDGGEGDDFLDGGDNDDEAIYDEIGGPITVKVLDPSAVPNGVTPNSSPLYELAFTRAGAQETDTLRDVETVAFDDGSTVRLAVQGNLQTPYTSTLRLEAGSGSFDVVHLSEVEGPITTTIQTEGADEFVKLGESGLLTKGFEVYIGSSDDDVLRTGSGAQTLYGGDGFDILQAGDGDDVLEPGEGSSDLEGGAGADTFIIGQGDDYILDADSTDRLFIRLSTINGSDPESGADASKIVPITGGFFELPAWDPNPKGYTFEDMDENWAVFKPVHLEFDENAAGQVSKSPLYASLGDNYSLTFSRVDDSLGILIEYQGEYWSVMVADYEDGDLGLNFQEVVSPYLIDGVEDWFDQYNPIWEAKHQQSLNQGAFPSQSTIFDW